FLSHRALEEAISIERSTSLPLEAPDCFKISVKRLGIEPTSLYRGVGDGITPLEHLAEHLKHALSNMEGLSVTKKGIVVQAILDVANATSDQILSRNFPHKLALVARYMFTYLDPLKYIP
ncbi:2497_t:CDS:2, partial [Diversispora eburnea]